MHARATRERGGLGRWVRPPALADPDERRTAASVHFLCLSFLAAAVAWAGISALIVPDPLARLPMNLGIMAGIAAALVLVHHGRVRGAAWLLIAAIWVGATLAVATSGSVDSPALSVYLVAIVSAGLLVGGGAAVGVTALSTAAAVCLAALEVQDVLPRHVAHTPWSRVGVEVTLFAAAAALLVDALRRIQSSRERVLASEAWARSLVDQAADGMLVVDAEGRVLEANPRILRILDREAVVGLTLGDLVTPEDAEDGRRLRSRLAVGDVAVRERRMLRSDGTKVPVEASITRLADGRFQAIVRDVSERKAVERSHDHLRVALEEAGEGIVLFDARGRLLYANRALRRLFDPRVRLEPGMPASELPFDPSNTALPEVRAAMARGETWSGRHERFGPDGTRMVHSAVYAPARERTGELVGYVGILRDVTREVELADSLRQSQKLEAVGQLAGGLAHDFNNLLTVILGAGEELHRRAPSGEVIEILEAARRAADLTTQLLVFSRQQPVRTERLDLNALVRETSPVLDRLVRENVRLELDLAAEPCWVDVDPNQLHQVLVNGAANARDAMPEGGRLTVRTRSEQLGRDEAARWRLEAGRYVCLELVDTGEGMSEDVVERVFEPFFTTKAPGRGTGLGLSSVHGIVQQAGGAVALDSRPGKGTTFRVYLPQAGAAPRRDATGPRPPEPARRGRILVVEDEAGVRRIMRRTLEAAGHDVREAADGEEALTCELPPEGLDLLITDVVLPHRGGPAVAEALRRRQPGLRVLFTSGHVPDGAAGGFGDGAGTEFLQKPFRPPELEAAVARLLGGPAGVGPGGEGGGAD